MASQEGSQEPLFGTPYLRPPGQSGSGLDQLNVSLAGFGHMGSQGCSGGLQKGLKKGLQKGLFEPSWEAILSREIAQIPCYSPMYWGCIPSHMGPQIGLK